MYSETLFPPPNSFQIHSQEQLLRRGHAYVIELQRFLLIICHLYRILLLSRYAESVINGYGLITPSKVFTAFYRVSKNEKPKAEPLSGARSPNNT